MNATQAEADCVALADKLIQVTAERDALAERLRGKPAMREIIGTLRRIKAILELPKGEYLNVQKLIDRDNAYSLVTDLLRRIDLESQTEKEP